MNQTMSKEEKGMICRMGFSIIALVFSFSKLFSIPVDWAWAAVLLCGLPIIKEAAVGLVTEFDIKADVLVSIALIASVIIGEVFAAGEIAVIMTFGAFLEEHTVAKAKSGIEKLVKLTPRTARVICDDKDIIVDAKEVKVGDILRVLPGETMAVDGVITRGETTIDESVLTGEPMPAEKKISDEVYSGTINQLGAFEMRATKVGEDSSLQRMIRLVESADAQKAKVVGMADRWATWVVVIAMIAAVITWIVTREILRSVTILVVFCPCAMVLATPTALVAGMGNAAKHGILVRKGDALERMNKVKKIAFDKTGTLTYGKPSVTEIVCFSTNTSKEELLKLTASVENQSEHPLGKAIVQYYKRERTGALDYIDEFQMHIGKGVSGKKGTKLIFAGNQEFLEEKHIALTKEQLDDARTYQEHGCTVIFVAMESIAQGFLVLEDIIRKEAQNAIQDIQRQGVTCVLITGDQRQSADYVGGKAGIQTIHAGCHPEDKMKYITQYQDAGEPVCMVGDGINDAPALKSASVGIAMGGMGSDIAVEAADIVLVGDDMKAVSYLVGLSHKTMRTITINLSVSMILNFAAIVLAITGMVGPLTGAMIHNIGSVVVIIHSAMLAYSSI